MIAKENNKNVWIGAVALLIVISLGLWWITASNPVDTSSISMATTTDATTSVPAPSKTVPSAKAKVVDTSVNGVVQSLVDGSRFAALYNATGVASAVSGKGPYTVFVPTNGAVGAAAGLLSNMSATQKKQLIEYHIVTDRAMDPSAMLSGSVQALSRDYINFSIDPKGVGRIDNAYVVNSYKATNGIVYLISAVLLPPKQ